jgi:hypothetical protein
VSEERQRWMNRFDINLAVDEKKLKVVGGI